MTTETLPLELPVRGIEFESGNVFVYRLPYAEAVSLHNWSLVQGFIVRLRLTESPDDLRVIVFRTGNRQEPR